jgi:Domain of unknown function (DUF4129)
MPSIDRATGRVIALIALVILAGVALRGYLPPDERATNEGATDSPAATIAVMTLITAALVILTVAFIATLRQPRTRPPAGWQPHDAPGGDRQRLSLRFVMILTAAMLVWLIAVIVLLRLGVRLEVEPPAAPPPTSTATPTATPTPAPPPPVPEDSDYGMFSYLAVAMVAMMVLWFAGIVVAIRRNRRPPPVRPADRGDGKPSHDAPRQEPLALAAERGLAEMGDLSREPREAIIACYAAMEDALSTAPGAVPQDSDTPSEVLARAVHSHAIHAGTATDLVELFAEARFSPHVMTEDHRETAIRALELVLTELRTAA